MLKKQSETDNGAGCLIIIWILRCITHFMKYLLIATFVVLPTYKLIKLVWVILIRYIIYNLIIRCNVLNYCLYITSLMLCNSRGGIMLMCWHWWIQNFILGGLKSSNKSTNRSRDSNPTLPLGKGRGTQKKLFNKFSEIRKAFYSIFSYWKITK